MLILFRSSIIDAHKDFNLSINMQLSGNLASLEEAFSKLPQVQIAKALSFLLVIYIAYVLAQLTWKVVPSNHIPAIIGQSSSPQSVKTVVDTDSILSLNLFGQFEQSAVEQKLPEVSDAPETKLNLTLSGVVASSDAKIATAIIEKSGVQETYGIGDMIKGTRAQLTRVHADRVIIKQSGRLESLMLEGIDYSQRSAVINSSPNRDKKRAFQRNSSKAKTASNNVDKRKELALSQTVSKLKSDLANDPGKISDYLNISPYRQGGKIGGYRLRPGKKPEFFQSSGLQSGDIAKQMNGLDLTNPAESAQALKLLKEASDITLLVERNGELTEILFSIAQ